MQNLGDGQVFFGVKDFDAQEIPATTLVVGDLYLLSPSGPYLPLPTLLL